MPTPEEQARELIDAKLTAAGKGGPGALATSLAEWLCSSAALRQSMEELLQTLKEVDFGR